MNPNREIIEVGPTVQTRILELGGTFLAYKEAGSGAAVVLIPALDEGSFAYTLQLERASSTGCRVVAFDNVGSGDSDRPAIEYRPLDYLRFAVRFLDKVIAEPATLCAHTDSAALVLATAISRPRKVAEVVLVNPDLSPVVSPVRKSGKQAGPLAETAFVEFVTGLRVSANLKARLRLISRLGKDRHRAFEYASLKNTALADGYKSVGIRRLKHITEWSDWIARIGEISIPVRVVIGERHRSKCEPSLAALRRELDRIDVVEMEGTGRYPMIERPDEFMRILVGENSNVPTAEP